MSETKTPDEWARAKGMLPAIFPGARKRAARPNAAFKGFAAARVLCHWAEGTETQVTEAEFDEAVRAATNCELR